MKKLTLEQLAKVKKQPAAKNWIKVGMSTCGIAAGADETMKALHAAAKKHNCAVEITQCGCLGMCYAEPLVEVCVQGAPHVVYGKVDERVASKIIEEHVCGKRLLDNHIYNVKG